MQALEYASKDLTEDREVVLADVSNNMTAMRYANEKFKKDREVVLTAFRKGFNRKSDY